MRNNQEFINTSVEYFEELEETILKTNGWVKANDVIKALHKVQESVENKNPELMEKLEEIESLFWDFSKATKKDYFKLGLGMKELIKENSDPKEND